MSIQPSLIIWTAICLCLAVLILNRLLFKPMLAFMDERQRRFDRADAMEREMEAEKKALEHMDEVTPEAARAAQEVFMERQARANEEMRQCEDEALLSQKNEIEDFKAKLMGERKKAMDVLSAELPDVSRQVAEKLLD